MAISKDEFAKHIDSLIKNMKGQYIDINAGKVHRELGGYPRPNHNISGCCNAMRSLMNSNDFILSSPPKGNGASLTVRYFKR